MFRVRIVGLENVTSMWRGWELAAQMYVMRVADLVAKKAKLRMPMESTYAGRRVHPLSTRHQPAASNSLYKSMRVLRRHKAGVRSIAWVGSDAAHAKYYTFGTVPHRIERRRAKVLTIFKPQAPDADKYGWIHRRVVNHPGTPAHLWPMYSWRDVPREKLQSAWRACIRMAAKKSGHVPEVGDIPLDAPTLESP